MASIRKRGNKWQARVRVKGLPTVEKSFLAKSDADAWAKIIEAEIVRGAFIKEVDAARMTLSEALDQYEREITPGKRGAEIERFRIAKWRANKLASKALGSLRGSHFSTYRNARLKEGMAPATVRAELVLISHLNRPGFRGGHLV